MNLQDYVDIAQSSDLQTFEERLVRFCQFLDFGIVTAALAIDRPGHGPGGPIAMLGNAPKAYLEAAKTIDYVGQDPVLRKLKRSNLPFEYDQKLYADAGAGNIWDFQAPFGFVTGIAVALHLPNGKHFLLGFDRDRPLPKSETTRLSMMASLQLLAAHAQEAAIRLMAPNSSTKGAVLTRREIEILRWTLDGKTTWEIGEILSISSNTVNHHFKNVLRKFDVGSKHQAALRALSHGIFSQ